ncbi:MAG: GntR family transcriptional regulator, partial [Culicoidibacterales bacterium]
YKIELQIREKQLLKGAKLPNVEQLLQEFSVSKSTITKALALLEKNGLIYQVQGSGIFVREIQRTGYINFYKLRGFSDDLSDVSSTVLKLEVQLANQLVASSLEIPLHAEVYYVKRLRFNAGQPFCLEESYFPRKIIPFLTEAIAEESLFTYFAKALKINPGFSDSYLHVIQLDQATAQLLDLPIDSPALTSEQIIHLSTGEPFDYSKITYHYQNSQFFLATTK